jgi:hypothetical protein
MPIKFKTGREALKKSTSSEGGSSKSRVSNYIQFFNIKKDESKFVHFFTDVEDIAVDVSMHRGVQVARKNKKGDLYDTWVDVVDRVPGLFDDGVDGIDWQEIMRDGVQHAPKKTTVGLLVELDPVYKDGTSGTRLNDVEYLVIQGRWYVPENGDPIFFPNWKPVGQSAFNFWSGLDDYYDEFGPINETNFKVNRKGDKRDTSYNFYSIEVPVVFPDEDGNPTDKVVDWSDLKGVPTLEEVLEQLGSHERYELLFGDESLWREQKFFNKPGYTEDGEEGSNESEPEKTVSSLDKLKKKAEVYN